MIRREPAWSWKVGHQSEADVDAAVERIWEGGSIFDQDPARAKVERQRTRDNLMQQFAETGPFHEVRNGKSGKSRFLKRIPSAQALRMIAESEMVAQKVHDAGGRAYWYYKGEFVSEDRNLDAAAVAALVDADRIKAQRAVERAKTYLAQGSASVSTREPIPDDVKIMVWQRDEGRCVKCKGNARLEYDHIIPVALGGSNTFRNLQLLCEDCNRAKSANLV